MSIAPIRKAVPDQSRPGCSFTRVHGYRKNAANYDRATLYICSQTLLSLAYKLVIYFEDARNDIKWRSISESTRKCTPCSTRSLILRYGYSIMAIRAANYYAHFNTQRSTDTLLGTPDTLLIRRATHFEWARTMRSARSMHAPEIRVMLYFDETHRTYEKNVLHKL